MNLADDDKVRDVLGQTVRALEDVIGGRIRYEQRRDQLTDLLNDRGLDDSLNAAVAESKAFWVAFIEVDKFKSINDRYGYQNADLLLKELAGKLEEMSHCFPRGATAFRAHGDEFYLLGELPSASSHVLTTIHAVLNDVRHAASELRVSVGERSMQCTVSVGWGCSADIAATLTAREMLACLERAVGEAKFRGRNCVVRYEHKHAAEALDSPRGDCASCSCKFSFDVRRPRNLSPQAFFCPNCGARIARPAESESGVDEADTSGQTEVIHLAADDAEVPDGARHAEPSLAGSDGESM